MRDCPLRLFAATSTTSLKGADSASDSRVFVPNAESMEKKFLSIINYQMNNFVFLYLS